MATYTGADKAIGFLFDMVANIAGDYSSSNTYALDAYTIYEGTLYKCINPISTPEDFTPAHWQAVLIMDEVAAGGGGGGGGTTVIANPSGTATETLNKLQVETTIYSIPSGGGGGGSVTVLCDNTDYTVQSGTAQVNRTYQLSDSVANYDVIVVLAFMYNGSLGHFILAAQSIPNGSIFAANPSDVVNSFCLSGGIEARQLRFGFSSNTEIKTVTVSRYSGEEPRLHRVYGIKL